MNAIKSKISKTLLGATSFALLSINLSAQVFFDADFQSASNGTISSAADLNNGTAVGSWTAGSLQESQFQSNGTGDRLLRLDQGKYSIDGTLATPAILATGVTFSIDFRNLRDGSGKHNFIRLRNESSTNMISLRLTPTSGFVDDDLIAYWNGSTWQTIGVINQSQFPTNMCHNKNRPRTPEAVLCNLWVSNI